MGQRCGEGRCTSALENAALVRPSRVTLSDALHIQELELIAMPLGHVRHAGPDLSYVYAVTSIASAVGEP